MDLQELLTHLKNTTVGDSEVLKHATQALLAPIGTPGFATTLLQIVQDASASSPAIAQAAAINFKNLVANHWTAGAENPAVDQVGADDRQTIRSALIGVLLASPQRNVQRSLHAAVTAIAAVDYPTVWDTLMPELIERLSTEMAATNFVAINAILEILAALVSKYENELTSDAVLAEMQYSLGFLQEPLLQIFLACSGAVLANSDNAELVVLLLETMYTLTRIFYSLNCHELPEYFDDHMAEWMDQFKGFLEYDNALVSSPSATEPSWLVKLQAQICRICSLYTEVADEEFNKPYLPVFVPVIWERMMKCTENPCDDILVITAVKFISSVAGLQAHSDIFSAPDAMRSICENVVLPNIQFRAADLAIFESDPAEYIRRDLEGGESDTRRGAASELIRSLCKYFMAPLTDIFLAYVSNMMEQYSSAPDENWIFKDAAIYLVTAMTAMTNSQRFGASSTNQFVSPLDFFTGYILPELRDANPNRLPVIKTACLRFAIVFRNLLPPESLVAIVETTIPLLRSTEYTVLTYASAAIAQLVSVVHANVKVFRPVVLKPYLGALLEALFDAIDRSADAPAGENQYVMRAIMRVLAAAESDIVEYLALCLEKLTAVLAVSCKNPGNPMFNRFMFESFAVLIRSVCREANDHVASFEDVLFGPFYDVLHMQIDAFTPFVFQLMARMLEYRKGFIPQMYLDLLPPLLTASMWEQTGNIPAMVRLVSAYVGAAIDKVAAAGQLEHVFGVFRKLIVSHVNDAHGFALLNSLMLSLPADGLDAFLPTVLHLLLHRISESRTTKFCKGFTDFVLRFCLVHGMDRLVAAFDAIQPGLWRDVLGIVAQFAPAMTDSMDRKMAAVALTNSLADAESMLGQYSDLWVPVLGLIISMFEDKSTTIVASEADAQADAMVELEYDAAFARLAYADKEEVDLCAGVADARLHLVTKLQTVTARIPFAQAIQALPDDARDSLAGYYATAGVAFA